MADCREKIIRQDCGTVKVGDGKVSLTQCGDDLGDFTMDQCENTTIDIPCPGDGRLRITACGTQHDFTANQATGSNTSINLDNCYVQKDDLSTGDLECDKVIECLADWEPPADGCTRLPRTWMESLTIKSDGTGNRPAIAIGVEEGGDHEGWYVGLAAGPLYRRFRVKGNDNWAHDLGCGGRPSANDGETSDIVVYQGGPNTANRADRFYKNTCIRESDGTPSRDVCYRDPDGNARVVWFTRNRLSNSDVVFEADEVDIQNLNFDAVVTSLGGVKEATAAGAINFGRRKAEYTEDGVPLPHPQVMLDPAELAAINPILATWDWTDDSWEVVYDEDGEDKGTQLIDNPVAEPTGASHEALIAILLSTVKSLSERVAALENPVP